jgi:gentisate 1,2-dioxygenase
MGISNGKVSHAEHKTTEMKEYLDCLPSMNLEPLWSRMGAMVPARPNPKAKPFIWRYSEVFPKLQAAGRLVPEEEAERRVLMLVNPSMGK